MFHKFPLQFLSYVILKIYNAIFYESRQLTTASCSKYLLWAALHKFTRTLDKINTAVQITRIWIWKKNI